MQPSPRQPLAKKLRKGHPGKKYRNRSHKDRKLICFVCNTPGHFAIFCLEKHQAFTIRDRDLQGSIDKGPNVPSQHTSSSQLPRSQAPVPQGL